MISNSDYFEKLDGFNRILNLYGNRARENLYLEFECILKKPTKSTFLRVFEMCRTKSCQNGWKNISNESCHLDIGINRKFRLTIYGLFYIKKFLRNEDEILEFPAGAWDIIEKTKEDSSDFDDRSFRFALKKEIPIERGSAQHQMIMSTLPTSEKFYRLKKRESYEVENEFVIDMTVIRQGKNKKKLSNEYEIELEYTPKQPKTNFDGSIFIKILNELLTSQRDSVYLKPMSVLKDVHESYLNVTQFFYKPVQRFPDFGPKVVSLSMERLQTLQYEIEEGVKYTITEKTDGLRMLGFIFKGELFLRGSKSDAFHPTNVRVDTKYDGSIFDGEYVNEMKDGSNVNHFLIFDCYFYKTDDIRMNALIDRLDKVQNIFSTSKKGDDDIFVVKKKDLRILNDLYKDSEDKLVEAENGLYDIDGLIYTPNEPVGGSTLWSGAKNGNFPKIVKTDKTFDRLLKWKDTDFNSIDFKITFIEDRDDFLKVGTDFVFTQMKECKLSVGYNSKTTPINYYEFLKRTRLMKRSDPSDPFIIDIFKSTNPLDRNSHLVCIPIIDDMVRCKKNNDWSGPVIRDGDIVEFKYEKDAPGLLKWVPIRIRKDKEIPNAFDTAIDIWKSYFNPVTRKTITMGEGIKVESDVYYVKNSTANDVDGNIRRFHRLYVKDLIFNDIFDGSSNSSKKLLDIASGRGGDLNRYVKFGIETVVGVDHSVSNLHKNPDGAYYRLLDAIRKNPGFDFSKYKFLAGDASKLFSDPNSFHDIYKEVVSTSSYFDYQYQFDAATIFFAIHYMFKDHTLFQNLLQNVDDNIKVGGFFGGCCFDGEIIDDMFKSSENTNTLDLKKGEDKILRINKKYTKKTDFGSAIEVLQYSIGMMHTEYLVSFELLIDELKKRGFVVVHTKSFKTLYDEQSKYKLSIEEQKISFLNRAFVFERKS